MEPANRVGAPEDRMTMTVSISFLSALPTPVLSAPGFTTEDGKLRRARLSPAPHTFPSTTASCSLCVCPSSATSASARPELSLTFPVRPSRGDASSPTNCYCCSRVASCTRQLHGTLVDRVAGPATRVAHVRDDKAVACRPVLRHKALGCRVAQPGSGHCSCWPMCARS